MSPLVSIPDIPKSLEIFNRNFYILVHCHSWYDHSFLQWCLLLSSNTDLTLTHHLPLRQVSQSLMRFISVRQYGCFALGPPCILLMLHGCMP